MAILPIYTYDAKVLREKTNDLLAPDPEVTRLITDMLETMHAANGIGLAANQVGKGHSLFVVDLSASEDYPDASPMAFINPQIFDDFDADIALEEGCLSVPNLREEVVRPERIAIRFLDANFEPQELVANGILARVIQHEYDHLNGVFFTDRLKGLRKKLIQPALKRIIKGDVEADYKIAPLADMYD
jgi:peptide deformylase